jgi:hypothetical protein
VKERYLRSLLADAEWSGGGFLQENCNWEWALFGKREVEEIAREPEENPIQSGRMPFSSGAISDGGAGERGARVRVTEKSLRKTT